MKLVIGHLYPDLLNLYGDRGNIQCMMKLGLLKQVLYNQTTWIIL